MLFLLAESYSRQPLGQEEAVPFFATGHTDRHNGRLLQLYSQHPLAAYPEDCQ